jgi:hypothetical protein
MARAPAAPAADPHPHSDAIDALRSYVARMPGAVELQCGYATADQCTKFAQNLGGRLHAIANQFLNVNARQLRVNYVHAASPQEAQTVYQSMVRLVGTSNTVARRTDVIVEIIADDHHAIEAVLDVLHPEEVHRRHHGHHW